MSISHNSYNATASIKDPEWNQVILGIYNSSRRHIFLQLQLQLQHKQHCILVSKQWLHPQYTLKALQLSPKIVIQMLGELCIYMLLLYILNGTTTFTGNGNGGGPGIEASLYSSIYFVGNTTFKKFFTNEKGAAIRALLCSIHFYGNAHFEGNEAMSAGGAIALLSSTTVYTIGNLTFLRNNAIYGGAMLLVRSQIHSMVVVFTYLYPLELHQCFMQFSSTIIVDNFQVTFIYNIAGIAGSALYGEGFDTCATTFPESNETTYSGFSGVVIEKLFWFESNTSDLSIVSSEPGRVCICEDEQPHAVPDCQLQHYSIPW